MPIYVYRCPPCDLSAHCMRVMGDTHPPECPSCFKPMRRRYTPPAVKLSMPAHFNYSAGAYVQNETQLKDEFKRKSEERTLRTGIEHRFVPVDPREAKRELGVTDEGLDATYKQQRDSGRVESSTLWL